MNLVWGLSAGFQLMYVKWCLVAGLTHMNVSGNSLAARDMNQSGQQYREYNMLVLVICCTCLKQAW